MLSTNVTVDLEEKMKTLFNYLGILFFATILAIPPLQADDDTSSKEWTETADWPAGKGICGGSWQYNLFKVCAHESHGKEEQEVVSAERCGGTHSEQAEGKPCGGDGMCDVQVNPIYGEDIVETHTIQNLGCPVYKGGEFAECNDLVPYCTKRLKEHLTNFGAYKAVYVTGSNKKDEVSKGFRGKVTVRNVICTGKFFIRNQISETRSFLGNCTEEGKKICTIQAPNKCRPDIIKRSSACGPDKLVVKASKEFQLLDDVFPTAFGEGDLDEEAVVLETNPPIVMAEVDTSSIRCSSCDGMAAMNNLALDSAEGIQEKARCLIQAHADGVSRGELHSLNIAIPLVFEKVRDFDLFPSGTIDDDIFQQLRSLSLSL